MHGSVRIMGGHFQGARQAYIESWDHDVMIQARALQH